MNAAVDLAGHNGRQAYDRWHKRISDVVLNDGIVPNAKQERILRVVHERCVAEETEEDALASSPLLRLVHALPGSGIS